MDIQEIYQKAQSAYCQRTSKSKDAYEKARQVMAGGETRSVSFYHPYPLTIASASGFNLYDLDGNEYIDFISNYTSLIHGHAHPVIMKKVHTALGMGNAFPAGIADQVELAEILCDRVPSFDKVRFCNSGTEATMFAVRAARAFTGKDGVLKMEGGYHGTTDFAEYSVAPKLAKGEKRSEWTPIPDSAGISMNAGRDLYIAPFNNLEAVENILKKQADHIAAIIVEPVLGAAGVIPPREGYLAGLRQLADQYQVLLIFDEVQTLRLSLGGAQEKYGVIPDLTAIAKIIGGGFPVGAFGGREDIMALFDSSKAESLSQSGTFNGNRATMAAGVASMQLLNAAAIEHLETIAIRLETGLQQIIQKLALPVSITRAGSLLNLHFLADKPFDYETAYHPEKKAFARLYHLEMLNRGIFCAPRGTIVLSTVMTNKEIDKAIVIFAEVMEKIKPLL